MRERNNLFFPHLKWIRDNTTDKGGRMRKLTVRCFTLLFLCLVLGGNPVEADMIGRWVFDGSHVTGNTVKDAVGNLDATIVGPVILNTKPPGLTLSGNNNYVSIVAKGTPVNLPQKEISAEAWVRLNAGTRWGSIINYSQDNGSFEKGWLLGYNHTHFNFAVSTTGRLIYLTCSTPFEIGYLFSSLKRNCDENDTPWYHVVGTFDGSSMKIYLNGRLEKSHNHQQPGNIDYADAYYSIGAYKDDDEFFPMDGDIHEVRVSDTVLTEDDIRANYESKKDLFPQKAELALGPYLQFFGTDSAIVRWWTNEPSPSVLLYGENKPGEHRVTDSTPKTEHEVTIAGLKPNTTYAYMIEVIQAGQTFLTTIYECDTFFNYSLPAIPERPSPYVQDEKKDGTKATHYSKAAEHIIKNTGITQGYCLVLGSGEGHLAYELAKRSKLRIIGVDDDAKKVALARKKFKDAGIYGSRVTVQHASSLSELPFANFFADLIVSARMMSQGKCVSAAAEMFRLLSPGGVAYLGQPSELTPKLPQEDLENWLKATPLGYEMTNDGSGLWAKIARAPLLGSGRWSHQYGSADNSANSRDTLRGAEGTAELEVQWLGRPGPRAQADRNGRKPSPLAINGRLFVQGLHRIIALNAYNGAILWSLEIPALERFNMPRDSSNWCADEDYVYAVVKGDCWRLDAATGHLSKVYNLISDMEEDGKYDWGYVARYGDKLFGSAVKQGTAFTNFWGGSGQGWYDATAGEATYKVCSDSLFGLEKESGKTAWVYQDGVIINSTITLGGGRAYFVVCRNDKVKASESRRVGMSELWHDQYIVALDANSGRKLWEKPIDTADGIVMFHLAYGNDALYLLSSGKKYNLYAYDAATGEAKWNASKPWSSDNHGGHMARPAIVSNTVFVRPYCFDADSGAMLDVRMPGGGCGTYATSTDAIIFRAGAVTMWSLNTQEITRWHRLRPGCWLSTIPACGLILSPEAGGGCSCGSWMETSIAFAPIYK